MTLTGGLLRTARALRPAARRGSWPIRPSCPAPTVEPDPDGLTRWQADHAGHRLAALGVVDRAAVQAALRVARPDVRRHLRRAVAAGHPAARVLELADALDRADPAWAGQRLRLLDERATEQRRRGARIDQTDRRSCGPAVLLVLAAHADPVLARELTAPAHDPDGRSFAERFDRRQRTVHRQSNRFWPRALGTTPWGMTGWLRRHAAGVGPYRVRLVDDADPRDLAATLAAAGAALDLGDPVPLLIGNHLPRHYVLALCRTGPGGTEAGAWRVFEPTAGEVRTVPLTAFTGRRPAPLLGFDRLHAMLLPE